MKFASLFVCLISFAFLTGFTQDDEAFERLCPDASDVWIEPSEEDFASYNQYRGFLNRRASWARSVEGGSTLSYFSWLIRRYDFDSVTFADRDYACYSHLTRG